MRTSRLEAFSDGIIAIAATLLVIELRIPAPGEHVWHAVREELPSIAAFAVSFLTILIFWVNHHALFARVASVDRGLLFLNGLLLLGISFISFPTAVLGRALTGDDGRSAAVLYSLTLAITSGMFTLLWLYLTVRPGLLDPADDIRPATGLRRSLAGPVLYLVAVAVALVSAPASLLVSVVIALYFAVPARSRVPAAGQEG